MKRSFVTIISPYQDEKLTEPARGEPIRVRGWVLQADGRPVGAEAPGAPLPTVGEEVQVSIEGEAVGVWPDPREQDYLEHRRIETYVTSGEEGGWQVELPAFSAGTALIRASLSDGSTDAVSVTVVDEVPPQVFITAPQQGAKIPVAETGTTLLPIEIVAFDHLGSIALVEYSLDRWATRNAAYPCGGWQWRADLSLEPEARTYELLVRASDAAGNDNRATLRFETLDVTPPRLEITKPEAGELIRLDHLSTKYTAEGQASDPQTGVQRVAWSLNGSAFFEASLDRATGGWTVPINLTHPGLYVLTVLAEDGAENRAMSTRTFRVAWRRSWVLAPERATGI